MLEQLSLFRNIGSCWTNACSGHSYWNETKNYSRFKSLDSLLISQAQDLLLGIAFSVPLSQNLDFLPMSGLCILPEKHLMPTSETVIVIWKHWVLCVGPSL